MDETELDNIILRSKSHPKRILHRSCTVGTSGHFNIDSGVSLHSYIRILAENDISTVSTQCLGSGRFGTCYLGVFGHYSVCIKVLKHPDNGALVHEANILSKFTHQNLPYLFGVSIGDHLCIITSFHGINGHSVTLHSALHAKSQEVQALLVGVDWIEVTKNIIDGLECLHNRHKLLHNDIKGDNIVLTSTNLNCPLTKAVIVDFGKACETSKGKLYTLSQSEKEQYKVHHPHIAPDLRDGLCSQSVSSDVFALGRVIRIVNSKSSLDNQTMNMLSHKCMQYHMHLRPDIVYIKQSLQCMNPH